jgi:outer membrane protein assembly factor BamD (BamD/ComL family)
MKGEISKKESEIKSSQKVDSIAVIELLSANQNFSSKFPTDSLSREYLYKTAGLASGSMRGIKAIDLYESVIQVYPHYKKIPECYFMEAFTYENTLGNIGKANELYHEFLVKYPDQELADDARTSIKFLRKSPEEMVREFEKMSADSLK